MASMFDPNAALTLAVGHHQAGRLAQAEDLYRQILSANPRHVDAQHNLGLILANRGAMGEAIGLFKSALEAAPHVPQFWFSLIEALIVTGQGEEAANLLDSAKTHKIAGPQLDQLAERANALRDPYHTAYQRHLAGDLVGAATLYQTIAAAHPRYADSLMMQGLILVQQGDAVHGLTLLEQATCANPSHAVAFYHWGNTKRQLGQQGQAGQYFATAIALDPILQQAFESLALSLVAVSQMPAARKALLRAQHLDPQSAQIQSDLGSIEYLMGTPEHALFPYFKAIVLQPGSAIFWFNIATAVSAAGRVRSSLTLYQRAHLVDPDFAALYGNYGAALQNCGLQEQALIYLLEGARRDPMNYQIASLLGLCSLDLGRLAEANCEMKRALVIKPDSAEAYSNLAFLQIAARDLSWRPEKEVDLLQLAEQFSRRSVSIESNVGKFWSNLAVVLSNSDNSPATISVSLCNAISCNPEEGKSYFNFGNFLSDHGYVESAICAFERSVKLDSSDAGVRYNLARAYLTQGRFVEGWAEYEWRWQSGKMVPRDFGAPRWQGEPLAGRRILLHAEQGIGDCVQFARYVPLVVALGASVTLEVHARILSLMASLPCTCELIPWGATLPEIDLECPLMSLPRLFATTLETIPAQRAYLKANQERVGFWRTWLGTGQKLRIGINWQGNPNYVHDGDRSMPLRYLAPLAVLPDVDLIVLQQNEGLEQIEGVSIGRALRLPKADGHQFDDTAALMSALDLIVTTDTSIAHVAGALGCPTILLLAFNADWRWLRGRDDCPWYPSIILARQPSPGDWPGAVAIALAYIEQRLAAQRAS
jgi:tetratricopeptide (TPR) repeat protein